jgi:hypothetical protein
MKQIFAILTVILTATCLAPAGEKMSDAEMRQKVIGYWSSGHHGWYIAPDGIMYMCPRWQGLSKSHWSVKDGKFNGSEIITLTDKKIVTRDNLGNTETLIRGTKEEVDPD